MELNEIFLGSRFLAAYFQRTHHSSKFSGRRISKLFAHQATRSTMVHTDDCVFICCSICTESSEDCIEYICGLPGYTIDTHLCILYVGVSMLANTHSERGRETENELLEILLQLLAVVREVRIKYLGAVRFCMANGISCDTMCRFKSRVLDDSFGVFI